LYARALGNLAVLYQEMGRKPEALEAARETWEVLDGYLEESFDLLGEQQRLGILQRVLHYLSIVLTLQEDAGRPAAERYALVLAGKGRVAARGALDRLARDEPALAESLQELHQVRARLIRLGSQAPAPKRRAAWLKQLLELTEAKQRLE